MRRGKAWRFLAAVMLIASTGLIASPVDDAAALIRAGHFAEARSQLTPIASAEPKNAAAHYYLGMALRGLADPKALEEATVSLKRATDLEPKNADYLADYGGACLELAEKNRSFRSAVRGRDALEQALLLDPADIDTHHALFEFYVQAPWPLKSQAKAAAHLEGIRARDPKRADALAVRLLTESDEFDRAFQAADTVLARNPDDRTALYEYGWCADRSGRNLERGIACLMRAAKLPPPFPPSPAAFKIWCTIGDLQQRRGQTAEARRAYETAVKLDPTDATAAARLARLK